MLRAAAAGILLLCLAGCGYIGPVLPPSPDIPGAVPDLAAVERGDQLVITFDTPPRTTDSLPIKRFSEIDLAIGPNFTPFDFERWSAAAQHYELPVPPPNDPDDPVSHRETKRLPVEQWVGKRIAVAVRTSVKKNDRFSQWSNRVVLDVIPPLHAPVVKATAVKEGYRLTWAAQEPGLHFIVFRQGPNEKAPVQIGIAETPEYVDTTSKWDTPYIYTVVAQMGSAESLPSEPVSVNHANTFPPAVPASITALAGPDSVEISWSRVPDSDLKGYYLYRSAGGGPFVQIGGLLTLPAYSDHDVQHGTTYRYEVSSVGQNGYVSDRSAPAEVPF